MRCDWRTGLLAAGLVATALAVVYVRHDARRGFATLQELELERDELITDWGRLQIEYATWAEGSRIESVARERLGLTEREAIQVMVVDR